MATSIPHVLFLNAQDGLGADIAVHLMLARTLDKRQVRVSAATSLRELSGASPRKALESMPDVSVLTLDLGRPISRHQGIARAGAVLHNLRGLGSLVRLAGWCRAQHVDLIHVTERPRQALFGLFVAAMAGCGCVIHAHTNYHRSDATRFSNWRLHRADAVVGVSHFAADTFRLHGALPESRVFAVHNAVDSSVFHPQETDSGRRRLRDHLGVALDATVIGCVARLMRWKGQDALIEALASVRQRFPRAHLVLAGTSEDRAPDGNGDFRDYLVRRIEAFGLQHAVSFAGFLPASSMPDFYAAMDVVAHPAIEEPFGLAVVEAMACARPVVAVRAGGIPEIIRDGRDGLLVPADQPAALAQALSQVIGDPVRAAELAHAGRQRVIETFNPACQAGHMLRIYQELVARRCSNASAA